jgi:hypothetical protein
MAEPTPPTPSEPGAPIARDQIDPDLVKLSRTRIRVGVITAAGLVVLCIVFLLRLAPDRRFAGASATPAPATIDEILAGKIDTDQLVVLNAEPVIAHALRVTKTPGRLGLRITPARGSHDRLWIVVSGDGGAAPALAGYVGRLRKLDELAFFSAAERYAAEHPRPVFAQAAAIRAGVATSTVTTVAGERVTLRDTDAIALDVIAADTCTIAASFNERLPDTAAWTAALERAGLKPTAATAPDTVLGQVRLTVPASVAEATTKLETAGLWDARVEPVTRHLQTTWATLRKSPPARLDVGGQLLPDAQIALVGLYTTRTIPAEAYAVVTGEVPDDYWYVMPITLALAAILLVFSWALVRAIRRDLVPARAA